MKMWPTPAEARQEQTTHLDMSRGSSPLPQCLIRARWTSSPYGSASADPLVWLPEAPRKELLLNSSFKFGAKVIEENVPEVH